MGNKRRKVQPLTNSERALPSSTKQVIDGKVKIFFLSSIFRDKNNRNLFIAAIAINTLLFLAYKSFFPLPDFFSDSNGYIVAAQNKTHIFYRPFGYSAFLQFVHNISTSHYFLVGLHYALLVMASLFCFFSIEYLFRFNNKKIKYLAWTLMAINPLLLVLSNQVASDSLFTALTVIWFTLLLWIIKRNNWLVLIIQVIILYWVFLVRYNALYYPIIAVIAFLLASKATLHYRLAGMTASILIIAASYHSIKSRTLKETGADVFTGFSGWQMANNALFIYKHIKVDTRDFDNPELQRLDTYVKHFIDSIPPDQLKKINNGELTESIFLWSPQSPLKQYTFHYCRVNRLKYFTSWYQVSELFGTFGKQIITKHPAAYVRYFLWNNLKFFFVPDKEFMASYNSSESKLPASTMKWFGLKSDLLYASSPWIQSGIVSFYPAVHCFIVFFSLIIPVCFLYYRKKSKLPKEKAILSLVILWYLFFLATMCFSIFAAIVTLRYEVALIIIGFGVPIWFLDQIISTQKHLKQIV